MAKPKVLVPASSPSPVRESQPQPETPQGTVPGHALFDSRESTPVELARGQRSRAPSLRKREQLESQGPAASSAPASETRTVTKSALRSSQSRSEPRKKRKRAAVLSASDDERSDSGTRQTYNKGTQGRTSNPKSTARSSAVAAASGTSTAGPVVLQPDTATSLGQLLGIDFNSTSGKSFEDTVRSLSNPNTVPMGSSRRYSKVRGASPCPLPSLNDQGEYYRNRMAEHELAPSGLNLKRRALSPDTRTSKRPHTASRDWSLDKEIGAHLSDREDSPPLPSPAALMGHFANYKAPSTSSTQRAVVNGCALQPSIPTTSSSTHKSRPVNHMIAAAATEWGLAVTPVLEPRRTHLPTQPRPSAPQPSIPKSQPAARNPHVNATHADKPPAPRRPQLKQAANSDTATQSETESEPLGAPVKNRTAPDGQPTQPKTPRNAAPAPQPHVRRDRHDIDTRKKSIPVRPTRDDLHVRNNYRTRDDSVQLDEFSHPDDLGRGLAKAMSGGSEEAVIEWAVHLMRQRYRRPAAQPSSMHPQPEALAEPSHSRHKPAIPSDLRARVQASARARTPDEVRRHARYRRVQDIPATPPSRYASDDLPEPDELLTAIAAAGAGARPPVDPDKNGLGKYPGIRKTVGSKAIIDLIAKVTQKGVYQDHESLMKMAVNAYRRAWKKYAAHVPYEEAPNDLLRAIALRVSWLRTTVKERVRDAVHHKLGFHNPGSNERKKAKNRENFAKLFPNSFHCRNQQPDVDQYESPALVNALCLAFFWTRDLYVIRYHERFEVMPLPAVAFVLTMMQECVEEWQTGRFHPHDLHSPKQRPIFDAHLKGLYVYQSAAPDRMARFQKAWFRAGLEHAGVTIFNGDNHNGEGHYCQPVTLAANVRPDTPVLDHARISTTDSDPAEPVPEFVPESEPEPEYDEDGRLTAKSKGKLKRARVEDVFSDD